MVTLSEKRKRTYQTLPEETKQKICGATSNWRETATEEQLEDRRRAARKGGAEWHLKADPELVAEVGRVGAEWHATAPPDVLQQVRSEGKDWHQSASFGRELLFEM